MKSAPRSRSDFPHSVQLVAVGLAAVWLCGNGCTAFDDHEGSPARGDAGSAAFATKAYPSRRIVEVARGFGQNGVIQSICQEDYEGAVNRIVQAIARHLGD